MQVYFFICFVCLFTDTMHNLKLLATVSFFLHNINFPMQYTSALLNSPIWRLCCIQFNTYSSGASSIPEPVQSTSPTNGSQPRAKRPRTCFTEEQIQILQTHFQREINPDSQAMEKIANRAGIHKRVAQVWFQNARARQKKEKGKKKATKFGQYILEKKYFFCLQQYTRQNFFILVDPFIE